jgi:hypothetical protein
VIKGTLTPENEALALEVAETRQRQNEINGRRDKFPARDPFRLHLAGARAEAFVAQAYGVVWHPLPFERRGEPDVAGTDVRWTTSHGLFIHPKDPDERATSLVTGEALLVIWGWLYAREAKRAEWWNAELPFPAFEAPRSWLRSAGTLPIWLVEPAG